MVVFLLVILNHKILVRMLLSHMVLVIGWFVGILNHMVLSRRANQQVKTKNMVNFSRGETPNTPKPKNGVPAANNAPPTY